MEETPIQETTRLLQNWARGDEQALAQLLPRVYRELRRIAAHALRNERAGYTMQATELVHEAYLRLVDVNQLDWKDRAHFLGVAATTMRRVLLDRARRRLRAKRKAERVPLNLDETLHLASDQSRELVALDDALQTLAEVDPRKARVVELRFFGGMDVKETAQIVGVSPETVMQPAYMYFASGQYALTIGNTNLEYWMPGSTSWMMPDGNGGFAPMTSNRLDGMLMHELFHNLGPTDTQLQNALGLANTPITDNISQQLTKDCFPGQ